MHDEPLPAVPNAEEAEQWNGRRGSEWVRLQERLDRILAPFGQAVLAAAAVRPGERVIDVGCGCGATALALARAVGPTGGLLGIDISEPMAARARERAEAEGLGAAFAVADASRYAFAPESVDLLFSRFGVMFFDDPVAAFANLRRALKPGGRLAFVCWREREANIWMTLPLAAARPFLPELPPFDPTAPGPLAFADRDRTGRILREAGFQDVDFSRFDAPMVIGAPGDTALEQAVDQTLRVGPLSRLLAQLNPDALDKVTQAVRHALAGHLSDAGIGLPGSTWIVTARDCKPAA